MNCKKWSMKKVLKFGGVLKNKLRGEETKSSIGAMAFPWILAEKHISLKLEMAKSDVKIKLNLLIDRSEIFPNTVELNNTSSGHYCLRETMVLIK